MQVAQAAQRLAVVAFDGQDFLIGPGGFFIAAGFLVGGRQLEQDLQTARVEVFGLEQQIDPLLRFAFLNMDVGQGDIGLDP